MKTFTCVCGQLIFFHNVYCMACNRELGFFPDSLTVGAIEPAGDGFFRPNAANAASNATNSNRAGRRYRKCQNYAQQSVCNWMIPETEQNEAFCKSCRLVETIPDIASGQNRTLWALTESAKRRLIYSLLHLNLPVLNKREDPQQGLTFRFLSNLANPDGTTSHVLTGHDSGVITMNIAEAEDSFREKTRASMNEPYRTLLGHFRHEIGHYYWDRLVRNTQFLERFRGLFGDERADYGASLQNYYASGAAVNWQNDHVSAYSTAHPWEDWAETWAHFMHIQDALEVADDFGIKGKPMHKGLNRSPQAPGGAKPDQFDQMIAAWMDLSVALNSINRSMGHHDLYPFVLNARVVDKLRFVAEVISESAKKPEGAAPEGVAIPIRS